MKAVSTVQRDCFQILPSSPLLLENHIRLVTMRIPLDSVNFSGLRVVISSVIRASMARSPALVEHSYLFSFD